MIFKLLKFPFLLVFNFIIVSCIGQKHGSPICSFPFKLIDNRIFIEVEINGVKGNFILDSGGRNGLNEDFAKKADIKKLDSITITGAGNGSQMLWYGPKTKILLVGTDIITESLRPSIVNLNQIRDSLKLPFFDGIIGEQLFRSYQVAIHYPDRKITLWAKDAAFLKDQYQKVSFNFYYAQIPMIKMYINKHVGDFIIDTGDRSELTLFPEFAKTINIKAENKLSDLHITGYGIGGPILAREFVLKNAIINDDLQFSNIKTRIPDHSEGSWARNSIAGSIGAGLLQDYEIIFDYENQSLFLKKIKQLSIE